MFWRILWRLLYASRGRLALAVIAVASGAAVCAALLNLNLDATDKLTREFRVVGANVVISAAQNGDAAATIDAEMTTLAPSTRNSRVSLSVAYRLRLSSAAQTAAPLATAMTASASLPRLA